MHVMAMKGLMPAATKQLQEALLTRMMRRRRGGSLRQLRFRAPRRGISTSSGPAASGTTGMPLRIRTTTVRNVREIQKRRERRKSSRLRPLGSRGRNRRTGPPLRL